MNKTRSQQFDILKLTMETITITTPIIPDDIPQINKVFYESFLGAHINTELGITVEDIDTFFKDRTNSGEIERRAYELSHLPENERFLVAKETDKVVAVCRIIVRDTYNQLQAMYVLPEYQGRGIGRMLWYEALTFFDSSKDIVVHVADYNKHAINFYNALGFVDTGKRFTEERHRMPISGVLIPEMEMRLTRD